MWWTMQHQTIIDFIFIKMEYYLGILIFGMELDIVVVYITLMQ